MKYRKKQKISACISGICTILVMLLICLSGKEKQAYAAQPQDAWKVGDLVTFGSYEQDNNLKNGKEPIEWEVLDVQDGKVLLLARQILDAVPYSEEGSEATWENSSIRTWLNKEFYQSAFSSTQKKQIWEMDLANEPGSRDGVTDAEATRDRVFCLSLSELVRYFPVKEYTMDGSWIVYADQITAKPTEYAFARGILRGEPGKYSSNENAEWWLRTAVKGEKKAIAVLRTGMVSSYGEKNNQKSIGARPAIWVKTTPVISERVITIPVGSKKEIKLTNLEISQVDHMVWKSENTKIASVGKDGTITAKKTGTVKITGTIYYKDGSTHRVNTTVKAVKRVPAKKLLIQIDGQNKTLVTGREGDKLFLSAECTPSYSNDTVYWVSDHPEIASVDENGTVHLKSIGSAVITACAGKTETDAIRSQNQIKTSITVQVSKALPKQIRAGDVLEFGSYEQDNCPENGKEPIVWDVVAVENKKALLVSRYLLDVREYHPEYSDVTWEASYLREWLNDAFYQSAFPEPIRKYIARTTHTNAANSLYGTDGGKKTYDRVFCLDTQEIAAYLLGTDEAITERLYEELRVPLTESAVAAGAYVSEKNGIPYGYWWLREPGYYQANAAVIGADGRVDLTGADVDSIDIGVRPAVWIKIN